MITVKGCLILIFLFFGLSSVSYANSCEGKGTVIFFVNGLFNSQKTATKTLGEFKDATSPELSDIKNLQYDLAWVEGLGVPAQLALAAAQRGVDDFQRFWLWVNGLEKAPDWFDDLIKDYVLNPKLLNATVLPRLEDQLELYSDAVLKGYQMILVSHSVGNFYANAALRALPDYVPAQLQPSIVNRRGENPFYPKTEEMIANIQIASPVKKTVNDSPWVNFKDDQVLNWIRRVVDDLPGNIDSPGVSPSDPRGHSFIPSYLRVPESRNLILQYMKSAQQKLRYPIPFFKPAATLQYLSIVNGQVSPAFYAEYYAQEGEITGVNEIPDDNGNRSTVFFADCYKLRPGVVNIRGQTFIDSTGGPRDFRVLGFSGPAVTGGGQVLKMTHSREIARWRLGSIQVKKGEGKAPIEADVKFLDQPLLRP